MPTPNIIPDSSSELSSLDIIEVFQRFNNISQHATSLDAMLHRTMQEMLTLFCADRAWVMCPSNHLDNAFTLKSEVTKSGWGGVIALGEPLNINDEIKAIITQCLESGRPQTLNTSGNNPHEHSFARTQVYTPLKPQHENPWLLGLHYCEQQRDFSALELQLLAAIAHRIEAAINSLITLQDMYASEERLKAVIEQASGAVFILDAGTGHIIDTNKKTALLLQKSREELLENTITSLSAQKQPNGKNPDSIKNLINSTTNDDSIFFEWNFISSDNEVQPCEVQLTKLPTQEKALIHCAITSISARKKAEIQVHKFSTALESTADAVMITDEKGVIEYINHAFEKMTGYSSIEATGKTPRILYSGSLNDQFYDNMWNTINAGKVFCNIFLNRKKDGTIYYEEKSITPLHNTQGEITHFISTGQDISGRMKAQEQLQFLAHHDILTQLPNRTLLMEKLGHTITNTNSSNALIAVLLLDLDRFKIINETLGHDIGDRALRIISKMLLNHLRTADTVARLGGDEFAIILEDVHEIKVIEKIVRKILDAFTTPLIIDEHEIFMTTSVGISVYPKNGSDSSSLLKNADIAMYRAKDDGRNTFKFYNADMNHNSRSRLSMETKLRHALEQDEFFLAYQPLIDIDSGMPIGAEALIRWQPQGSNPIPPIEFISILEETGLIVPVGEWVLNTACAQLRKWHDAGATDFRMSINLSSRQFRGGGLEGILEESLKCNNMKAPNIELEITESMLMEQNDITLSIINRISEMGFHLSIDDFGTGYSSLSYLKRLPVDTLKIDRSFVNDLQSGEDGSTLVEAIVAMAKSLRLKLIAEGVETPEQLAILKEMNCDIAQGYYFSKPVSPKEFNKFLLKEPMV